jgi:hypothetical protein
LYVFANNPKTLSTLMVEVASNYYMFKST